MKLSDVEHPRVTSILVRMRSTGRTYEIWITPRSLMRVLEREKDAAERERLNNSCTRCGTRLGAIRWDGSCGRVLCKACGQREDAPVLRKRKRRASPSGGKGDGE